MSPGCAVPGVFGAIDEDPELDDVADDAFAEDDVELEVEVVPEVADPATPEDEEGPPAPALVPTPDGLPAALDVDLPPVVSPGELLEELQEGLANETATRVTIRAIVRALARLMTGAPRHGTGLRQGQASLGHGKLGRRLPG